MALVILAAGSMNGITAYAATARIAFSDPSVTVGQEFNVNVKITASDGNLGAADVMLSYDPSCIEFISGNNASGGAGSVRIIGTMDSSTTTQFSHTLKFRAIQAGNTTISVGNYEIYDVDTQAVNVTQVGSSAVKVNAPATYSSEAGLASLKVSPGQLTPDFSSGVTSYSVNVGGDVSKLAVSASAKHEKAKVLISGDSGLQAGANTVTCKVTAEDGQTTKTYTITVNKSEAAEVSSEAEQPAETSAAVLGGQTVDVGGVQYTIASSFDPAALPEGYSQSACSYGEAEVMCGTGNGVNLLYLQAADGTGSFFIYVPETGALSPYVTIDVAAKSILVLPPDESVALPEGFVATTIQINGNYKVQGWVWQSDGEQQYCVVYGMNESGAKNLYRYDIAERTFQRYFQDPALQSKYDDAKVDELIEQYNALCEDYNFRFIIIIVLIVVCLILFFVVINLLLRRKEGREDNALSREAAPVASGRGVSSGQRMAAERGGSSEKRAATDRHAATEQNASARHTRTAEQTAYPERSTASDARRVSGRTEAPERRMTSGPVAGSGKAEPSQARTRYHDPGMEEAIRQRELERAERARKARERLEQERLEQVRLEEERRIRMAARESAATAGRMDEEDDDFEFIEI